LPLSDRWEWTCGNRKAPHPHPRRQRDMHVNDADTEMVGRGPDSGDLPRHENPVGDHRDAQLRGCIRCKLWRLTVAQQTGGWPRGHGCPLAGRTGGVGGWREGDGMSLALALVVNIAASAGASARVAERRVMDGSVGPSAGSPSSTSACSEWSRTPPRARARAWPPVEPRDTTSSTRWPRARHTGAAPRPVEPSRCRVGDGRARPCRPVPRWESRTHRGRGIPPAAHRRATGRRPPAPPSGRAASPTRASAGHRRRPPCGVLARPALREHAGRVLGPAPAWGYPITPRAKRHWNIRDTPSTQPVPCAVHGKGGGPVLYTSWTREVAAG